MPTLEFSLRILVPLLYWAAAVQYVFLFSSNRRPGQAFHRSVWGTLIAAFSLFIWVRGLHYHRCPFGNVFEGILFVLWLMSLFYFVLEWWSGEPWLGMLLVPVNAALATVSFWLIDSSQALPLNFQTVYFPLHVSLSLVSYCFFFFSFLSALVYLKQFRDIKSKQFGPLNERLPPLEKIEDYIQLSTAVGLLLFALGTAAGVAWSRIEHVEFLKVSVKSFFSFSALAVYLCLFALRVLRKVGGLRLSYLAITAFALILANLSVGRHAF